MRGQLQVVFRLLPVMQDTDDQHALVRRTVKHGMAVMLEPPVASSYMSGISSEVRELCQYLERLMKAEYIAFGTRKPPSRYRVARDALNVRIRRPG